MKLEVKDADGQTQSIVAQGVGETVVDRSGDIDAGDYTVVMEANAERAGLVFQNVSNANMLVTDLDIDSNDPGWFLIGAGQYFPPAGYPVPLTEIRVAGTVGGDFTAREW